MCRDPGAGQDGGRGCWKAGGRAEEGEGCELSLPGGLQISDSVIAPFFLFVISLFPKSIY